MCLCMPGATNQPDYQCKAGHDGLMHFLAKRIGHRAMEVPLWSSQVCPVVVSYLTFQS